MFGFLTNAVKAAASVALTPVAVVVDVVTAPSTAIEGEDFFQCTEALLTNASECLGEALKPEKN